MILLAVHVHVRDVSCSRERLGDRWIVSLVRELTLEYPAGHRLAGRSFLDSDEMEVDVLTHLGANESVCEPEQPPHNISPWDLALVQAKVRQVAVRAVVARMEQLAGVPRPVAPEATFAPVVTGDGQ